MTFQNDRPIITIRSEIVKNGEERITIMSEECHEVCKKLFETLQANDLVFGSDTCLFESNLTNHELYFGRVRERFRTYRTITNQELIRLRYLH